MPSSSRPVILTGDRTTGPLHLGHYVGSLRSRVELQHIPHLRDATRPFNTLRLDLGLTERMWRRQGRGLLSTKPAAGHSAEQGGK